MPRTRFLVVALVTLLAPGAAATGTALGGGAVSAPVSAEVHAQPNNESLGYGFGAQTDQPFHEVGSQAVATLFFFNLSRQDAFGFGVPFGGGGCSFSVNLLDARGRLVRRPKRLCPLVGPQAIPIIGPFPLPAGTFRRVDVLLPLMYAASETGDPDGEPLPGGLYTLKATHFFDGPRPGWRDPVGPGGDPEARVPFRVFQCTQPAGPLPIRELARGSFSGYRAGDPTFSGEDLVLRMGQAALEFWRQHTATGSTPPPAVDLSREMVLVTLLGPRASGEASVRITSVEEKTCHLEVTVVEEVSPVSLPVITHPFDIVAVPRSLKEVVFVRQFLSPPVVH